MSIQLPTGARRAAAAVGLAAAALLTSGGPAGAAATPVPYACAVPTGGSFAGSPGATFVFQDDLEAGLDALHFDLGVTGGATATATAAPGGLISYHVALTVDPAAIAAAVHPAFTALPSDVAVRLANFGLVLPVPAHTTLVGSAVTTVSTGGPSASASVGSAGVTVSLGAFIGNSAFSFGTGAYAPTPAFTVTVDFQAQATSAATGDQIDLLAGQVHFDLTGPATNFNNAVANGVTFVIPDRNVGLFNVGADGPEACTSGATLATTLVVSAPPVLTATTTTPEATSSTTTTGPATTSPATTPTTDPQAATAPVPTVTTPTGEVQPVQVQVPASGGLARTGSDLAPLGAIGACLVALGSAAVIRSRRRPTR